MDCRPIVRIAANGEVDFAPNLHTSVAIAAVNLRHVEYSCDRSRLENLLFEGTLSPHGGSMKPGGHPGHGLELREADAAPSRTAR